MDVFLHLCNQWVDTNTKKSTLVSYREKLIPEGTPEGPPELRGAQGSSDRDGGITWEEYLVTDPGHNLSYAHHMTNNCLLEIPSGKLLDDIHCRSATYCATDQQLYVGASDKGQVVVYGPPVNGTRRGRKTGKEYTFAGDWTEGVIDVAVAQEAGGGLHLYALSGHTNARGKRLLYSGALAPHARDGVINPTFEVPPEVNYVVVDPTNQYVFLAGSHTLMRLDRDSTKGELVNFMGRGALMSPPVFSVQGETVYCCTLEADLNEGTMFGIAYRTTDPASRTDLQLQVDCFCSSLSVDPQTQDLYLVWPRYLNPPTVGVVGFTLPGMKQVGGFLAKIQNPGDLWTLTGNLRLVRGTDATGS
ncbi:hypothetical protein [Streptomyces sp. I05A-00742]|uniref:hypothetical protein n=1 Tax=Streptomyces sp. I05A-00742 TaxID=2732853 RepID=UPI0014898A11|nr:hypothetical protein [Streptomyces sp. I05A-00742]